MRTLNVLKSSDLSMISSSFLLFIFPPFINITYRLLQLSSIAYHITYQSLRQVLFSDNLHFYHKDPSCPYTYPWFQSIQSQNIPHGIYYPIPLHLQKAYKDERYNNEDFKVTNKLSEEVLSLPMHSELDQEQIDFITSHILKFMEN